MSIARRIEDAKILYDLGRHEGALLSVLVAVGATSRLRLPQGTLSRRKPKEKMSDGEAFETFLAEEMAGPGRCSVWFGGKCNPAESLFYKWLRCRLAHEGGLPEQIVFHAGRCHGVAELRRLDGPMERLSVTYPIVLLIGWVVCSAKENANLSEEVKRLMLPSRA